MGIEGRARSVDIPSWEDSEGCDDGAIGWTINEGTRVVF